MKKHALILLALFSSFASAQELKSPYEAAMDAIAKQITQDKAQAANNKAIQFFGNVQTDVKKKIITIRGCATGIKSTDPVEFFIATADSGKDYEAISIAPIKPSDLHAALEAIGLKPGHPVDYATNHYWSRGPRVIMKITKDDKTYRAEDLVLNLDTKKTLPHTGLLFTGSKRSNDNQYAADVIDSRTIASIYNDPNTVLDLPDRTSQSGIYGFRKVIPDLNFAKGDLLTITIEAADEITIHDLKIHATADGTFSLQDKHAEHLAALVQTIATLVDGKSDWHTTVTIDDNLTIDQIRKLYAVLMSVEGDKGIKLDPPGDKDDLYHRAFFPDESWRTRENRLSEPWELFLSEVDGKWIARLERQIENPDRASSVKQIVERFSPASPEELLKIVTDKKSQWTQAIFVYPPDTMTYCELKKWVSPALPTYPKIFVFPDRSSTTQPTR